MGQETALWEQPLKTNRDRVRPWAKQTERLLSHKIHQQLRGPILQMGNSEVKEEAKGHPATTTVNAA